MRSVTFNQALLAVGLIGLTLALILGQGNSFAIVAARLVEDGPSIVGPVVLLVVSFAIPLAVLATAWRRMASRERGGEAEGALGYGEARIIIGLVGLILVTTFAPQVFTANAAAGWEVSDSITLQVISLIISISILGAALRARNRGDGSFGLPQVLTCLGLIALVIVASAAPGLRGILVAGSGEEPDLIVRRSAVAWPIYHFAAPLAVLAILAVLRWRRQGGAPWTISVVVVLAGVAASFHFGHTLALGVPLAAMVVTGHFAQGADNGSVPLVRTGPLLVGLGLLGAIMSASSLRYVIGLYHACSPFDASLYLWPTLALVVAVVFSLGILGAGVRKLRVRTGDAEESWGE